MKKLLPVLLAASLMIACSKKDNNPASPTPPSGLNPETVTAADIMGTWKATLDTAYVNQNGQLTATPGNVTAQNITYSYGQNGKGSTSFDGDMTYSVAGGIIYTTGSQGPYNFHILSISSKQMIVSQITAVDHFADILLVRQ
ncbi:hypothetical protein [Mucilaginibacter sp. SG564]|uniref:hypothetical protein n=1 Tax=Mucilaginibacter sp. SG564 TaxID=2587022 RepID=UPI0015561003|nr:hypothetical protein [Mucilaginibacter sp. SG564]NOW96410.1 hypothetical protein [Mucilaginibacter sp. SG564]